MSVEKWVHDARGALSGLLGTGAVSQGQGAVATWKQLAARARALGLTSLADRCDGVAEWLGKRGQLAFEPQAGLADAALEVFDQVEALAATLALWSVEVRFDAQAGGMS
jgi:hypothetical protein